MADLGQLSAYIDEYDIVFKFGRTTHKIKPSAEDVLDFMRNMEGFKTRSKGIDQYDVWELVAPLLGARFDRETFRFEAGPEDHPHRDLVPNLLAQGMDIGVLDRVIGAAHVKYMHGDDVAEEFVKTGSLGKALRSVREREQAELDAAEKATPRDTGGPTVDG